MIPFAEFRSKSTKETFPSFADPTIKCLLSFIFHLFQLCSIRAGCVISVAVQANFKGIFVEFFYSDNEPPYFLLKLAKNMPAR